MINFINKNLATLNFITVHEINHFLFYSVFAIVFRFKIFKSSNLFTKKNLKYYFIGLITTFFLDTDHLIDYFIYKKSLNFNLFEFLSGSYFDISNKFYVFFHGWEFAGLVLLASFLTKTSKLKIMFLFIFAGLLAHLILDTITYSITWDGYSIIMRALSDFDVSKFK